jgi:RNA polymerase sigma-70 factor (ECF subfamily)
VPESRRAYAKGGGSEIAPYPWPDRTPSGVFPSNATRTPVVKEPAPIPTVYRRILAPIRAKSRRILGDGQAAEDVAQEAFVRLLQFRPNFIQDGDQRALVAWVYRTTTRLALDVLRERKRRAATDDVDALPCGVRLDEAVAAKGAIQALSDTTPPEELEAAVFCRVDGLSQPEAAALLDVSERTVRRLLERFDERTRALREEHAR